MLVYVRPKSNDQCHYRTDMCKHIHKDKQGRRPGNDIGRDWSDATVSQGILIWRIDSTHQMQGRNRERVFPRTFKGSIALPICSFQKARLQKCDRINFHSFKTPSLWYFVMPALGNYTYTDGNDSRESKMYVMERKTARLISLSKQEEMGLNAQMSWCTLDGYRKSYL